MKNKIEERIQREKTVARLACGFNQMKYQPWKVIFLLVLLSIFTIAWKGKNEFISWANVPVVLVEIMNYAIATLLLLFLGLSVLSVLTLLGYIQGVKDEEDLRVAFGENNCKNGHPILWAKRTIKRENVTVTVREFFTRIPKKRWEEMQDNIQDELEVTLVSPFVEYGGRNHDKGKRIVIYSIPGRKLKDWGTMYEEEL